MAAFLFAVAGGIFIWRAVATPYKGYSGDRIQVEVRHGWNTATILRTLEQAGVLRDDFVPLIYLKILHRGESLKAGVYRFDGESSPVEVIAKMIRGDVVLKSVTIPEGWDRFAITDLMIHEGFGTRSEWKKELGDTELIADLDPQATSLEGYLFPDTYKLAPGTAVKTIVQEMVSNFHKHFGPELAFISNDMDVHNTVVLASIVETEARIPAERPLIAAVYLNRMKRHMLLQADPTVIYALKRAGEWNGDIRRVDLKIDSPYNTYRYHGFPPGPIANPGMASLQAAAHPADTPYLYFVSRNDGTHVFATTLAEHNRNVAVHQKKFWRDRRSAANR